MSTFSVTAAHAAGGIQGRVLRSITELPCDSFVYPVSSFVNSYEESAGTPQRLIPGAQTWLLAEDVETTQNSVTVGSNYEFGATLTLGWNPSGGLNSSIAGNFLYTSTYQAGTTTSVAFTSGQRVVLKSLTPYMTATPTYYKEQLQADYYRSDRSCNPVRLTWDRPVRMDVVRVSVWELDCGGRPCVLGKDYIYS